MLLLCALIVGSGVVWADDYTITFANSASSTTGITSSTNASTTIANNGSRSYVTAQPYTVNSGNCYYGDAGKNSIRIGKSGNSASLTIALSSNGQVKATSIVVSCVYMNSSNAGTLNVNSLGDQDVPSSANNLTFSFASATDITNIVLSATKPTIIYSIKVNYVTGPSATVSTTSLAFGEVGVDFSKSLTFTVAPANLTSNLSLSCNNDKYSISPESIAQSATTAQTITVTANPTSTSDNMSGTITISGGGLSENKTVTLTTTPVTAHEINWSVNGEIVKTEVVKEGVALTFAEPESGVPTGFAYKGWSEDEILTPQNTEPTMVTASNSTTNVTYYAVLARENISLEPETKSYGFETASDTNWEISGPTRENSNAKTGSYAGKINTANSYVTFKNKVKVTNFSFAFKRTSNNENYNVYIETSSNKSTWTAAETYAMSSFNNGSYLTKSKSFDGSADLYVRFHCYNTTAVRYVDDVSITYNKETITYSDYCTYIKVAVSTAANRNYGSYVTPYRMDFGNAEGITAYISTGFNGAKDAIVLTSVDVVDGGVPIIVRTETQGASVDVHVTADDATDVSDNKLVAGDGTTAWNGTDGYTYYYLASDLFHKATSGTLQTGKAYLKVANGDTPSAPSAIRIVDEDNNATNATNIQGIEANKKSIKFIDNGQIYILREGIVYDALGRIVK